MCFENSLSCFFKVSLFHHFLVTIVTHHRGTDIGTTKAKFFTIDFYDCLMMCLLNVKVAYILSHTWNLVLWE